MKAANARLILGIPRITWWIVHLKLLMYWKILVNPTHIVHKVIKANYVEWLDLFRRNGYRLKGIKDQYPFPTSDFAATIIRYDIDTRYLDPINLPFSKWEWHAVINMSKEKEYDDDLKCFIEENGYVINFLFKNTEKYQDRIDRIYSGIWDIINATNTEPHIDSLAFKRKWSLILNVTKMNWKVDDNEGDDVRICAVCKGRRHKRYNEHLLFDCHSVDTERPDTIKAITTFGRNRNNFNTNNKNINDIISFCTLVNDEYVSNVVDRTT